MLTETGFLNRLSFDAPLDIRLRSDALANTILFIGYSMSDPNIRLLLHRIWQIWEQSGYRHDRPRSFVFMPIRNPVQEAILAHWGITTLTPASAADAEAGLARFLTDIKARVAADTSCSPNVPRKQSLDGASIG